MSKKNNHKERLGHGHVKKYKTGSVYIPAAIWDMVSEDDTAEYVADMQSVLIFKPDIDPEILLLSIDLIKKYLENKIARREVT